ncbi:cation:dicarboxylase symporter family transporter, partial [Escherichia coli]|nr:cation:dicarboxylase symporter family transporter [Escherichia coli]
AFVSSVFVAFIKMLVVPLVSICIIKVIIEIDKNIKISSLLGISLFWILFSTAIAATLGIFLGYSFDLGSNLAIHEGDKQIR